MPGQVEPYTHGNRCSLTLRRFGAAGNIAIQMSCRFFEVDTVKQEGISTRDQDYFGIEVGVEMIPKQAPRQGLSGDVRTPDALIAAETTRQAVDEEKQRCIRIAWDVLWWELEPLIGIDKVNEVAQKIQLAIRSHRLS